MGAIWNGVFVDLPHLYFMDIDYILSTYTIANGVIKKETEKKKNCLTLSCLLFVV